MRFVYESGLCGFWLARDVCVFGLSCAMIYPNSARLLEILIVPKY